MKQTPKHYRPKEISWLSFNARVLQEAANTEVPLLERVKFLGIYSNNLDEFFRVRVATLNRLTMLGKKAKKIIGYDPHKVLMEIQQIVIGLNNRFDQVYQLLLHDLAKEHIHIINEKQLSTEQKTYVRELFHSDIRPKLIPIMIDNVEQFPDMRDDSIYLAISLESAKPHKPRISALIEVPSDTLSRFIILPQHGQQKYVILLDDVIRFNLNTIFSFLPYDQFSAHTVKLTRDAELDIADDVSQSYISKVSSSLKRRKEGNPVRFVYDAQIPEDLLKIFIRKLKLSKDDALIPGARYHNFKDFIKFPGFGLNHLKYESKPPIPHKYLDPLKSMMAVIRRRDLLLHYPYQSFDHVIDLLREAAIDPKVKSIKITLYRVARSSSVINALINAVKNGKMVVVVLELQARFDEEANIVWANKLTEEGVKVLYGVPGLKVHAKLCLITRRKRGGSEYLAIIGTGNFNEDTARIYSDHSLFTADRRLTMEVNKVFDFFENNYYLTSFRHLIVSPFDMRKKICKLIKTEIQNAKDGQPAYIILKLNNLVDGQVIGLLYKASQVGVDVRLMVRGMFSVVTEVPEVSQELQARGLIDKYLEHSRIYAFCNKGNPKYYMTSADLMHRNIDRRVEVTFPIYDTGIQNEIRKFLEIQWLDTVKSRVLDRDLSNQFYRDSQPQTIRAQWKFYDYLEKLHQTPPTEAQ